MMVMKFMKKKVCKCFRERKVLGICLLTPDTTPQLIMEVVKDMDVCLKRPANPPQVIAEVMDVGQV